MKLFDVAEQSLAEMKKQGSQKSLVQVSLNTAKEFNIEGGNMTLLRTTFDQNVSMKSLLDQRQATSSGNQFSADAIQALAQESIASAKATPPDEAYGFAPSQGKKSFQHGSLEPNDEWMYSQMSQLLSEVRQKFPKTILEGAVLKFVKTEKVLATSEGTLFDQTQGHYEGFAMFTSKDGKKASSFNYVGFQIGSDLSNRGSQSLLETSGLEELLHQSTEQIEVQKIPSKFEGDILVTPHCLESLSQEWLRFLSSGTLMKKNSFFQGKKGQKVASDLWTMKSTPLESNFGSQIFWTGDGYAAENEALFENGVLKNYLLGHYAAQKLGEKTSKSGGEHLQIQAGQTQLQELISQIKEGILLARLSVGNPAENGDFSGVAKNSYYVKDGKIQYPVNETMISGNLQRMLMDLQGVSKETINMGNGQFPWVRFSGMTVS